MKTLCMDTAHKDLIVTLLDGDMVVAHYQENAWKRQSERMIPVIDELMKNVGWQPQELQQIVITKGPGSYTGVRIAMTIAKILATRLHIPVYTLSTLQLYAGRGHCYVVLDARGKRVYCALYENGKALVPDTIMTIEDFLSTRDETVSIIGDGSVLELVDNYPEFKNSFLDLKDYWLEVKEPHLLSPEYLKDNEAYKV